MPIGRARPWQCGLVRRARPESRSAPDKTTIFISYMREDADAARRLYDAITTFGGDVWMDEPVG